MENKNIETFLAKALSGYEGEFKDMVNASLEEFSRMNSEALHIFLFKTILGKELRKNIAIFGYVSRLTDIDRYGFAKFNFERSSPDEAVRLANMLNSQSFKDYLKNEFEMELLASAPSPNVYLVITLRKI